MIDPKLFTVESLLAAMLDDSHGNLNVWRKHAEIIPQYMPPFPDKGTRPTCIVRVGDSKLRYSHGPRQGYFWDIYGDDFGNPVRALLALMAAPVPPSLLRPEAW